MTFLPALIQWLHIASVVLMIGGFFFLRVVLLPASRSLPENYQLQLIAEALRRFRVIVWIALVAILSSGIYNFVSFLRSANETTASGITPDFSYYILVLGIKLFIVFLIFTLGIVLTFPYPVFDPFQKRPSPWINLTMILGLFVIFLSAFLRRM